jgi:hypothetical protein
VGPGWRNDKTADSTKDVGTARETFSIGQNVGKTLTATDTPDSRCTLRPADYLFAPISQNCGCIARPSPKQLSLCGKPLPNRDGLPRTVARGHGESQRWAFRNRRRRIETPV